MLEGRMGIRDWFRSSGSTRERLLAELADVAGRKEALVERLGRHATMCAYPNVKSGLEQLAVNEAAHLKVLRAILDDNDLWPRPPEPPSHDGSNNWERLGLDLELAAELGRMINRQSVLWEPLDPAMANRFADMYAEDYDNTSFLRDLALKCDPQAFD
jgi:hypothetical protein